MSISVVAEAKASTNSIKSVLQRPLVIGASVSGDYFTASPGKRLSLRYTEADQIVVMARNGKPAREVLKALDEDKLKGRTAIIGLDLFFWDSFGGSLSESLSSLEKLRKLAAEKKLPLILGEIPLLSPQLQPHASNLNKRIHEICKGDTGCKVLPLNSMLKQVILKGHIIHRGERFSLDKLLPDGLHIAEPASEYLADRLAELIGG